MKISYSKNTLEIDGVVIATPWPVREAFESENKVIVLLDPFATITEAIDDIREIAGIAKGRNVFCYSSVGLLLWKAEFPNGDGSEDYYYRISSQIPLRANSFSSFRCEIDLLSGKIIRKEFFK